MKQTVKTECDACAGTGIYCGFAEPKGYGIICNRCDGTGCREITFKSFEGRHRKRGVEKVIIGHSFGWVADSQENRLKNAIPIEEFYKKVTTP